MSDNSPAKLWQLAAQEFPNDQAGRRIRYIGLMREHGHLRPTLPGESRDLPCGWPSRRSLASPALPEPEETK